VRIEQEKLEAAEKMKEDVIEVRPEIMQLLEQFGASALHSSTKTSCARSLALLKKNSKKRSRAEFDADRVRPALDSHLVGADTISKRMKLNPPAHQ
jgi:hypothetical protein